MWTYVQRTGHLYHDSVLIVTGYSGANEGRNDPAMESVADLGPIPCDLYTIGRAFTHPEAGPFTLRLTPNDGHAGNTERSGFLIHGDNLSHTASHGCIIVPRPFRLEMDRSVADGDDQLEVISEERQNV